MTDPSPTPAPTPTPPAGQSPVRMLAPLGGHDIGDLAYVDSDLVDTYVQAGYVEALH